MKKLIIAFTAAAFVGGATLATTTTPASALLPIPYLMSKEDKKFKAVNPYAKKKAAKKGKKAKKAMKPAKKSMKKK